MTLNKYKPHVYVLPEDDANRQIANSFTLHPKLIERVIQVLPPAGGWPDVLEKFIQVHAPQMQKYPEERFILLIDFDLCEDRLVYFKEQIPANLQERVFVIGVLSEPEQLRTNLRKSFEEIGEALANDCAEDEKIFWEHELLKHNKTELECAILSVKPFLFCD